MIDLDRELREAEPAQESALHQADDFGIGAHAGDADDIGVALPEFAVAPPLRTFAAEDRRDMVTLEGKTQLVFVLADHARQGHGQVITHGQRFAGAATVLGAEDQLFGVFAIFAKERFMPLENRRADRLKAEAMKLIGDGIEHVVAPQHGIGQEISKALGGARSDCLAHRMVSDCASRCELCRAASRLSRARPAPAAAPLRFARSGRPRATARIERRPAHSSRRTWP